MAKERKKSSILRILYLDIMFDAVIAMTTDISIEFDRRVFPRIKRYCIFFLNLFKEYSFKNIRNK